MPSDLSSIQLPPAISFLFTIEPQFNVIVDILNRQLLMVLIEPQTSSMVVCFELAAPFILLVLLDEHHTIEFLDVIASYALVEHFHPFLVVLLRSLE